MIHDFRDAWKWLSVQAAIIVGIIAAASDYFPQFREYLPEGWVKYAAVAIIVARMIKQKGAKIEP